MGDNFIYFQQKKRKKYIYKHQYRNDFRYSKFRRKCYLKGNKKKIMKDDDFWGCEDKIWGGLQF